MVRIDWSKMTDQEQQAVHDIEAAIRDIANQLPILSACRVLALYDDWKIDEFLATYVDSARDQGHSWQTIGEELGVSRQAVWERWAENYMEAAAETAEQDAEL